MQVFLCWGTVSLTYCFLIQYDVYKNLPKKGRSRLGFRDEHKIHNPGTINPSLTYCYVWVACRGRITGKKI